MIQDPDWEIADPEATRKIYTEVLLYLKANDARVTDAISALSRVIVGQLQLCKVKKPHFLTAMSTVWEQMDPESDPSPLTKRVKTREVRKLEPGSGLSRPPEDHQPY